MRRIEKDNPSSDENLRQLQEELLEYVVGKRLDKIAYESKKHELHFVMSDGSLLALGIEENTLSFTVEITPRVT